MWVAASERRTKMSELVSIEARVVIASVETYLKYAEAIGLTATAASPNA